MNRSRWIRSVSLFSIVAIAIAGVGVLTWIGWSKWQARHEYERVRTLAANLANDEFERRFRQRPFHAEMYEPELRDDRWHWGTFDPAGLWSAEVSFRRDRSDPRVRVFWATDAPHSIEHPLESPPNGTVPIPILPPPDLIDQ